MAERLNVFISFAEEDRDAASELMRELRLQGIDTYDFTRTTTSRVGKCIDDNLTEQLRSADYVVTIVSRNSTSPDKQYTHFEIEEALNCGFLKREALLAVLLDDRAPKQWIRFSDHELRTKIARFPESEFLLRTSKRYQEWHFFTPELWQELQTAIEPILWAMLGDHGPPVWFGPFETIRPYLWARVRQVCKGGFRDAVRIVCDRLGVDFARPVSSDSRLPLYDRLQRDIDQLDECERQRLLNKTDKFDTNRVIGDWRKALKQIDGLIGDWPEEQAEPYYPTIIKGLCLLHLGEHQAASDVFCEAVKMGDQVDENAWGGLAKASYYRRMFADAISYTRKAIALCHDDAFLARSDLLSIALTVVESADEYANDPQLLNDCHVIIRDESLFRELPVTEQSLEDQVKIRKLEADRQRALGDTVPALQIVEQVLREPVGNVQISENAFSEFPKLSHRLLANIADVELYFEDDSTLVPSHNQATDPTRDDFTIQDGDRRFRFARCGGTEQFEVFYLDAALVISRFELKLELGQVSLAVSELEQVAALFEHPEILHRLALLYDKTGKLEKARCVYDELCCSPFRTPHFLLGACRIQQRLGDVAAARVTAEDAIELSTQASTVHPQDRRYYMYYLGYANHVLGRDEEANVYFRESAEFDVWYDDIR